MCALLSDAGSGLPLDPRPREPSPEEPLRPVAPPSGDPSERVHGGPDGETPVPLRAGGRLRLLDHRVDGAGRRRVRARVTLGWRGLRWTGEATGSELPGSRQQALAEATLRAVSAAAADVGPPSADTGLLEVEGVKVVEVEGHRYALVSVYAEGERETRRLAGSASLSDGTPDLAVVLATLGATDRWVSRRPR